MVDELINKISKYEFEDIVKHYEYDNKDRKVSVRFFPNTNIATITESYPDENGKITTRIVEEGMSYEEIVKYFPPFFKRKSVKYNKKAIIRAIVYEAYQKEGTELDEGNVRNFWYTHIKHLMLRILGEKSDNSNESMITQAWGDLINSGLIRYEGMNIIGGKENFRLSVVKDSPFNNLIVAVEKIDFFEQFSWIPKLFNCTLITAGGQPSLVSAYAFIKQLKDLGIDLDQTFYMIIASDLDPAGYIIQDAFRKQYEAAIKSYGGSGKITIKRLFVRKDQVTQELLEKEAIPCADNATKEQAKKAEDTKWEHFCEQTNGGLYINVPDEWTGRVETIDDEEKVRALLEMNVFPKKIIEESFVRELLKIIEATNDESKIMIPEIMRMFEVLKDDVSEEIYEDWHQKLIKPLINDFLIPTKKWERDIEETFNVETEDIERIRDEKVDPIETKYNDEIEEIKEACKEKVEEKQQEAYERAGNKYDYGQYLDWQIERLQEEKQKVEDEINEQCEDIFSDIKKVKEDGETGVDKLKEERDDETREFYDDFNNNEEEVYQRQRDKRKKLETFIEDNSTVFNPLEMDLKQDIEQKTSEIVSNIYFRDIEQRDEFKEHINKLLIDPEMLEDGISCFEQSTPTFLEEDLLKKASANFDENIENVRQSFTGTFLNTIKQFMKRLISTVKFEISNKVPSETLHDKVEKAMEEVEDEIGEASWKYE